MSIRLSGRGIQSMRGILETCCDRELLAVKAQLYASVVAQMGAVEARGIYQSMADETAVDGMSALFALYGKEAGEERPPRRPHTPGETYRRISRLVDVGSPIPSWDRLLASRDVGIRPGGHAPDPSLKYPEGTPLEIIDGAMGRPHVITYEETQRSLAYNIMLREGRGGYGTRKSPVHMPKKPFIGSRFIVIVSRATRDPWKETFATIASAIASRELSGTVGLVRQVVQVGVRKGMKLP